MSVDNRNIDRDEERQTEKKKTENRHKLEQKMKYEPMKTFEAKLSEKTANEMTNKDSALRDAHNQKKSKAEKDGLLQKIIGAVTDKSDEDKKTKVAALHKNDENETEGKKDKDISETDFELEEDSQKGSQKTEQKSGEASAEGHRRVAEKQDGEGGEGGGGFGDGAGEEGDGHQGFGSQSGERDNKGSGFKESASASTKKVGGIKKGKFGQSGFESGARQFSAKDLDEIVSGVELGINEHGEEEFTVELTDDYYDGLKVSARRTDEGVVLQFDCPNVSVRSTFLKSRPKMHARLRSKGVQVKRIEVV